MSAPWKEKRSQFNHSKMLVITHCRWTLASGWWLWVHTRWYPCPSGSGSSPATRCSHHTIICKLCSGTQEIWPLVYFMLHVKSRKTNWKSLNVAHKPAIILSVRTYPKHSVLNTVSFLTTDYLEINLQNINTGICQPDETTKVDSEYPRLAGGYCCQRRSNARS